jgi:hypothetical protein
VDPEAITDPDLRRAMPIPGGVSAGAFAGDRARTHPALPAVGPSARVASKRGAGWRFARNALITLVLLGIVGTLAWASVIRPTLHQRVESALRANLDTGAAAVVSVPRGTHTLSAATVNAYLAAHPVTDSPLSEPEMHFTGGRAVLSFTLLGERGSVSTALYALNGRLYASGTIVDGWLSVVENGDEMQATINEALSYLPASDHVASARADHDELVLTLD